MLRNQAADLIRHLGEFELSRRCHPVNHQGVKGIPILYNLGEFPGFLQPVGGSDKDLWQSRGFSILGAIALKVLGFLSMEGHSFGGFRQIHALGKALTDRLEGFHGLIGEFLQGGCMILSNKFLLGFGQGEEKVGN